MTGTTPEQARQQMIDFQMADLYEEEARLRDEALHAEGLRALGVDVPGNSRERRRLRRRIEKLRREHFECS